MKDNIYNNKELSKLFKKDALGIAPDATVRERLEYTYMLKSSGSTVNQNSFLGMFTWLFSWSHLPFKAALVSVVLLLSLLNIHPTESQFLLPGQDTTLNAIPFQIDSSDTSPFFADTCFQTKGIIENETQSKYETFTNTEASYFVIKLSPAFYNTFPIAALNASYKIYLPFSRKLKPVGLSNTTPAQSPLFA